MSKSTKKLRTAWQGECPVCERTFGLSKHHIYGKGQSTLTMDLCACCHLEYNKEASAGKPGPFSKAVWEWVIQEYCQP